MANNPTIKATVTAEDKASSVVRNIGSSFEGLGKSAGTASLSFGKMTGAIGLGSIAATAMHTAMTGLENATKSAVNSASSFEQYRVGFETMLGSADAARTMLSNLSQLAATTPFTLPGLAEATKQMLAMGISANEVLPDIKALGDISAGVGSDKLPEISLAFAQVAAKGHLAGQEIIQFSNAGVPIIDEVAKSLGKTSAQTLKLSEAGQISFGQVRKAIIAMTEPGGRFFDLMEKQSKTFGGTVSNISDQMGRLSRQILGISEGGDIQAGGPFAKLKDGAVRFMNFITANASKISAFFQGILYIGEEVFKGIKAAVDFIGPSFLRSIAITIAFGAALFGFIKIVTTVATAIKTLVMFGMGPLGMILTVVSILAGVVLTKAFKNMGDQVKGTTTNSKDLSKALNADVPSAVKTTGQAVDKLGEQLADLDDQIKKSTRDYQQQMAQMVKETQDKVKSLQGQLDDETSSFKDAQDQEAASHADKVQTIQDQMDKENQMGVLADQTKLANLQKEIDKENAAYSSQTTKEQNAHDKKMADLKSQYDQETQLLQKHADDVQSVQNVSLLDQFQALEQSNADQMIEYNKQKQRIIENAGDTGTEAGGALATNMQTQLDNLNTNALGQSLGASIGSGLKSAFWNAIKDLGTDLGNWATAFSQTMIDVALGRQLTRHKTVTQLFNDELAVASGTLSGLGTSNDVLSAANAAVKKLTGKATGGNVQAGRTYWVGEQGPEPFTPNVNGVITPNNKTNSMNSSQPINITIQAQAFTGSQIEARKFATMIMDAYQDAMKMKGQTA